MYDAVFIIRAFVIAGLGGEKPRFMKSCLINAAKPEIAGVE
jgi:hypothetical protein